MKKFIIGLSILSIILIGITYMINQMGRYDLSLTYVAILFFACANLLVFYIGTLGAGKSTSIFLKSFYTSFYLQLFFSLAGILIYLIFSTQKNKAFIISYLVLYIFYTAFEIYHLLITLRAVSKNSQSIEK